MVWLSERLAWLCVLVLLPATQGYGTGAPRRICYDRLMNPRHYLPYDPKPNAKNGLAYPQTTDSPYSLTLENGATTYAPGQTVKVCVRGQAFEGLFLQMRAVGENGPVGTFDTTLPSNTKLVKCKLDNDSVTQSNPNSKVDPTCFIWMAPDNEERDLNFVATVLKTKIMYWVGINSDVITAPKLTSVAMTSSTTATFTSVMTSSTTATFTSVMTSIRAPNVTDYVNRSPAVTSFASDVTTQSTTSGTLDTSSELALNATNIEDDNNGSNSPGMIFTTLAVCALLSITVQVLE